MQTVVSLALEIDTDIVEFYNLGITKPKQLRHEMHCIYGIRIPLAHMRDVLGMPKSTEHEQPAIFKEFICLEDENGSERYTYVHDVSLTRNGRKRQISSNTKRFKGRGNFTREEWYELIKRQKHLCAYCKQMPIKLTIDHVVPISRGGMNTIDNVQALCGMCNEFKDDNLEED